MRRVRCHRLPRLLVGLEVVCVDGLLARGLASNLKLFVGRMVVRLVHLNVVVPTC